MEEAPGQVGLMKLQFIEYMSCILAFTAQELQLCAFHNLMGTFKKIL